MNGDPYQEFLYGDIRIVRADREPCPVCNHPTGDCTDGAVPDHIVLYGTVPSMDSSQDFLVEEDVIGYRQITPFTKARVILAHKGQRIPLSKARELGLF